MSAEIINITYAARENKSLKGKDGENKKTLDHIACYGKSASGSFRIVLLAEKVLKLAAEILNYLGRALSSTATALSKQVKIAKGFLSIPRLPSAYQNCKNAIVNWRKKPKGSVSFIHDKCTKIGSIAESGSTVGYAVVAVTGNTTALNGANILDFVSNAVDLPVLGEDYNRVTKLYSYSLVDAGVKKEVRQRFQETKNHKLMMLIKTIISTALGALGLLVLAFGGPVVPAVALLTIGVLNSILAIGMHFYKETRSYELIDFAKVS